MAESFFFLHGTQYALSRPTKVTLIRATDVSARRAVDGTIRSVRTFPSVLRDPVQYIRFDWSDTDSATRCLHDHIQALFATGAPSWLQCDSWLDYTDVLLIQDPDDTRILWAQHDTIRPPDFHPGFQNFETWTGTLLSVDADGVETVVDDSDFEVNYQTGQVTLDPSFTIGTDMTFRLSYIYVPMVVVTECNLTPEKEEWGDEEYLYETHTYRGSVTFQVVTPSFSTYLPNPTFTGCLERTDTTDFSDVEKDFPDDGPIIPPYPEPSVIYRDCYPDDSRWEDIRGTFFTTTAMTEIPLGNVISGAEFFEISSFIWERNADGTYEISGTYRLIQGPVADRTYTKEEQFGGVYDTAKQGFITGSTTKTVMGEYYDTQWPITFGRATPAQHRGQFYGSIAHVTTPDNSTRFPLRNDGTVVVGSGYGRYTGPGSLAVSTYDDPAIHYENTKDSTNGIYFSKIYARWEEFPSWGVILP